MHQQSGEKFGLKRFILGLIRDELVRQNIYLAEDEQLIHVSRENNQLPEFRLTTSIGELVASSLIHGGTTRYLLDLNYSLIQDANNEGIKLKIAEAFTDIARSKAYIETLNPADESAEKEHEAIEIMGRRIEILQRELRLRNTVFKRGERPPEIKFHVQIMGDKEELHESVMQILREMSPSSEFETDDEDDEDDGNVPEEDIANDAAQDVDGGGA
jgi:hypothetical protein